MNLYKKNITLCAFVELINQSVLTEKVDYFITLSLSRLNTFFFVDTPSHPSDNKVNRKPSQWMTLRPRSQYQYYRIVCLYL